MPLLSRIPRSVIQSVCVHKNHINLRYSCNSKTAQIINGKEHAEQIQMELKQQIEEYVAKGNRCPVLTAILVGEDPASHTYVRNKMNAAKAIGVKSDTIKLPASITQDELIECINKLNNNPEVDGILVQLPVPQHINERDVCNAVVAEKDVDGFNEINVGRLALDMKCLVPATAAAVYELLKRSNIETFGKNAVVIGRSKNVSMPTAMLLHTDGRHESQGLDATVTICHRYTPEEQLVKHCQAADIIVSATGIPGLIKRHMIKPGACVIDVGITRITDKETGKQKLAGDVEYDEVRKLAGFITPVPGGVGPMTVAMLMRNTFLVAQSLAEARKAIKCNGP